MLDLAADIIAALCLPTLVTATGALAAFYRYRALVRAGARLLRVRLLRAGQRRKLVLGRLAVRSNFFAVQTPIAVFVRTVQLPLQVRIALAQLVGSAVVDAVALKIALPSLGQPVVDSLCPGDLALGRFEHLGNVTPQLARQLDHAARLQILERRLDLLCRRCGVLCSQAAAAARHGVGPVQDQRLDGWVKVSIEHNTGRGLAVKQRQRIPPAVSCKE